MVILKIPMQGYCVPGCAEDVIGMTFYRYVLTNVVSINGVELLSALGKKCLHMESHLEPPWVSVAHTSHNWLSDCATLKYPLAADYALQVMPY